MKEKTFPVITLISADTVLTHEYVANIEAIKNVEIRSRVEGFLEKVHIDEGQSVKKGQLLFTLTSGEYRENLVKANANLKNAMAGLATAEVEVQRIGTLVEKNVISKTELKVAKAKLEAAKAKVDVAKSSKVNAEIKLSYTSIHAPFSGTIDRIPLKVGSLVDIGTLLTKVSDVSEIYAYFNVSENEYLEYIKTRQQSHEVGNKDVKLVLADGSNYNLPGKIETMEGEIDRNTGSIAFRAKFKNPSAILKHGSSGKIKLANDIKNALILPQKAVFEIQDRNFVFLVGKDHKVMMKSFTPKARFSHFFIVQSGLKEGDKVVYEGIQSVRDGVEIEPEMISMDSLLAVTQPASQMKQRL